MQRLRPMLLDTRCSITNGASLTTLEYNAIPLPVPKKRLSAHTRLKRHPLYRTAQPESTALSIFTAWVRTHRSFTTRRTSNLSTSMTDINADTGYSGAFFWLAR